MTAKKEIKAVASATKEQENTMYIGPTIGNLIVHGTTFKGGKKGQKIDKAVEEYPAMGRLFIPLSELPEAMKQIYSQKGALTALYKSTQKYFTAHTGGVK